MKTRRHQAVPSAASSPLGRLLGCLLIAGWAAPACDGLATEPPVVLQLNEQHQRLVEPTGDDLAQAFTVETGPFQIEETTIDDGTIYTTIQSAGRLKTSKKGYASLPFGGLAIELPPDKSVRLESRGGDYQDYPLTHPLLPSRGTIYRNQNPAAIPYSISADSIVDDWYPGTLASMVDPYILRDVRGTTVHVYPFQYNASTNVLRVYASVQFQLVEDAAVPPINPLPPAQAASLEIMDSVYQSVFVNHVRTRANLLGEMGDLLVIYTSRDATAIQPYIQWKREKGLKVKERQVTTGTNVQSAIKEEYASNPKLLYVQLVGDWADIKSPTVAQDGQNYPGDPMLGCVAGSDNVPDLFVGRFSANSASDVTVQVDKAVHYERDPDLAGTWYAQGLGIGSGEGPGDDGEIDSGHIDVIKQNKLLKFTYAGVTDAYGDPDVSVVKNKIDSGVGIINYCGHGDVELWVTSGFSASDARSLTNGNKLPFIFSVACVNGLFSSSSDCLAEALLKKSGGGAVASLMATIYMPWEPPMRGQDYINDLLIGGYNYTNNPGNGTNTTEGRTTFGSIVFNGLILMYAESAGQEDLDTIQTWHIFGDSSLQVRTKQPKPIQLSSKAVLPNVPFVTQVTSQGTPVAGALVSISNNNGGTSFSALTGADGKVSITHSLATGTVKLTVTGFNLATIYEDTTAQASVMLESFSLMGTASDADPHLFLFGGGQSIPIDASGAWTVEQSIAPGPTSVTLDLSDTSGNQTKQTITLTVEVLTP